MASLEVVVCGAVELHCLYGDVSNIYINSPCRKSSCDQNNYKFNQSPAIFAERFL